MLRWLLVSLALVALLGCGDDDDGGRETSPLVGRTFHSTDVSRPLVEGTTVSLTFHEDGRLSAYAGCNSGSGAVDVTGDRLVLADLSQTDIGCPPELHAQDEWLLGFLTSQPAWSLDGDTLTLTSGRERIVLEAEQDEALEGTTWRLDGLLDGDTVASLPAGIGAVELVLAGGELSVTIEDCNQAAGAVEIDGGTIAVTGVTSSQQECPEPVASVEDAVHGVLDGDVAYEIDGPRLTIRHPSGRGLLFRAVT